MNDSSQSEFRNVYGRIPGPPPIIVARKLIYLSVVIRMSARTCKLNLVFTLRPVQSCTCIIAFAKTEFILREYDSTSSFF